MKKHEFIKEVNDTIEGINLTNEDIDYIYKDTSNLKDTGDITIGYLTATVTITYKGKKKTYQAGHGTTFPCEFIDDYNNGYYSE